MREGNSAYPIERAFQTYRSSTQVRPRWVKRYHLRSRVTLKSVAQENCVREVGRAFQSNSNRVGDELSCSTEHDRTWRNSSLAVIAAVQIVPERPGPATPTLETAALPAVARTIILLFLSKCACQHDSAQSQQRRWGSRGAVQDFEDTAQDALDGDVELTVFDAHQRATRRSHLTREDMQGKP